MIQMTYKKRDGEIIRRTISTYSPYRVGDVNSYGWTVQEIKYLYDGKWLPKREYDRMIDKHIAKDRKIMNFKRKISTIYKNLGYLIELMIILRVFEIVSRSVV